MGDCLFCKISAGDIPADVVFEDDDLIAFRDIHPQAPTHILIVPRKHLATLLDAEPDDTALLGKLQATAIDLARSEGLADDGFRLVMNTLSQAGQSVFHIHLHLLGGRAFSWPPG